MNLREQLRHLANSQSSTYTPDKCRLFYDGSIRTRTVTESGGEGWLLMAAKVPGAGPMFGHFFSGNDARFLSARDLRQALELRDRMLIDATQERTLRTMRKIVRKEVYEKARKAGQSVRRVNVRTVSKEETKREDSKESELKTETSPVLFL